VVNVIFASGYDPDLVANPVLLDLFLYASAQIDAGVEPFVFFCWLEPENSLAVLHEADFLR
jgi:hypothetical protein